MATSRQNSRSTSRRNDGAPGDFIDERPVNAIIQPAGRPIPTSVIEVLRRPVESALYAERLMYELGYYTEPGARIGFLLSGLLRAARVVLDIGLHLQRPVPAGACLPDSGRWTPALARQFLRDRCHKGTSAGFELARYLGRPAPALTYKIGERTWLEGRENIRRAHGADFDLREFHTTALNLDPLGLSQLRYALSRQAKPT